MLHLIFILFVFFCSLRSRVKGISILLFQEQIWTLVWYDMKWMVKRKHNHLYSSEDLQHFNCSHMIHSLSFGSSIGEEKDTLSSYEANDSCWFSFCERCCNKYLSIQCNWIHTTIGFTFFLLSCFSWCLFQVSTYSS